MSVVVVFTFHNQHVAVCVQVKHPATIPAKMPLPQKYFAISCDVADKHQISSLRRPWPSRLHTEWSSSSL